MFISQHKKQETKSQLCEPRKYSNLKVQYFIDKIVYLYNEILSSFHWDELSVFMKMLSYF